jgi:hypothetical protein
MDMPYELRAIAQSDVDDRGTAAWMASLSTDRNLTGTGTRLTNFGSTPSSGTIYAHYSENPGTKTSNCTTTRSRRSVRETSVKRPRGCRKGWCWLVGWADARDPPRPFFKSLGQDKPKVESTIVFHGLLQTRFLHTISSTRKTTPIPARKEVNTVTNNKETSNHHGTDIMRTPIDLFR